MSAPARIWKSRMLYILAVGVILASGLWLWSRSPRGHEGRQQPPKRSQHSVPKPADNIPQHDAVSSGEVPETSCVGGASGVVYPDDDEDEELEEYPKFPREKRKGGGLPPVETQSEEEKRREREKWRPKPINPSEVNVSKDEAITIAYNLLVGKAGTRIPLMSWAEFHALVEPHMKLQRDIQAMFPYVEWGAVVWDHWRFEIDAQTGFLMEFSSFETYEMKLEETDWIKAEEERMEEEGWHSDSDMSDEVREKLKAYAAQEAKIPLDEALERARQFVASVYPDFLDRNFQVVEKGICVSLSSANYVFDFREVAREDAPPIFPNRIWMFMHPDTGLVGQYQAMNERYVISEQPKISKEEAERIAYELVRPFLESHPDVKVRNTPTACRTLLPGKTERVRVWWLVEYDLEGKLSMVWNVWVDAETGESYLEK